MCALGFDPQKTQKAQNAPRSARRSPFARRRGRHRGRPRSARRNMGVHFTKLPESVTSQDKHAPKLPISPDFFRKRSALSDRTAGCRAFLFDSVPLWAHIGLQRFIRFHLNSYYADFRGTLGLPSLQGGLPVCPKSKRSESFSATHRESYIPLNIIKL